MNLFPPDPDENLLSGDSIVHYHGPIFTPEQADKFLQNLLTEIPWKHDEARMFVRDEGGDANKLAALHSKDEKSQRASGESYF